MLLVCTCTALKITKPKKRLQNMSKTWFGRITHRSRQRPFGHCPIQHLCHLPYKQRRRRTAMGPAKLTQPPPLTTKRPQRRPSQLPYGWPRAHVLLIGKIGNRMRVTHMLLLLANGVALCQAPTTPKLFLLCLLPVLCRHARLLFWQQRQYQPLLHQ